MSHRTAPRSRDLALTSAAAVASFALSLLASGGLPKAIVLTPLVLFLPGYALSAAMFLPGKTTPEERLVYAVGMSVGAAVLSGLLWQLLLGLDRFAWTLLLTAITLIACGVAQSRRIASPMRKTELPGFPRLGWLTSLAIVAAIALAGVAVNTATEGIEDQRGMSHFSALWIVPAEGENGALEIGIWNHLGTEHDYRLLVDEEGRVLRNRPLRLGPHQRLQMTIATPQLTTSEMPGRGRVVATLYKDGVPYRRVEIEPKAKT